MFSSGSNLNWCIINFLNEIKVTFCCVRDYSFEKLFSVIRFCCFTNRYGFIAFPSTAALNHDAEECAHVLHMANVRDWCVGRSKVFLRYYHPETLYEVLEEKTSRVITVQKRECSLCECGSSLFMISCGFSGSRLVGSKTCTAVESKAQARCLCVGSFPSWGMYYE